MTSRKVRLDILLVDRGLALSRERAQSLILAGKVLVNDEPATKAGRSVFADCEVRIRGVDHGYVSRGGIKLAAALDHFQILVEHRTALDVGASTGGFTDVLLGRGISKVFAVDVGHNQLAWKIRQDPRVIVHEGINARHIDFALLGEPVDLIVIDVSFISLDKILAPILPFMRQNSDLITLIKPQFEVGKEKVGKGGIVTNDADRLAAVKRITQYGESLGLRRAGLIDSPIAGTEGNKEFLAHWKRN